MSTRFPYKERRVGKNPKIALTRSSSTPSNPYGSRAEACQPETMISAARQGMGMIPFPRTQPVKQGRLRIGSLIFRNVPIREEEEFLLSSFYRGRWGGARPPRPSSPVADLVVMSLPYSKKHPEGLTCLRPTASRREGGGCQSCQPDFRDFPLPSLFMGESH